MMASKWDEEIERQLSVIRNGAVELFGEGDLRDALARSLDSRRPLRVKLGLDPSAPDLHLGHSVVLTKLRRFQDLGHTPIFLVGDFTARIGDPSGKKSTRPALDPEQVAENAKTYVEQAGRLLDVDRAEVRFNGEWMDRMPLAAFVRLCSQGTVARMLERDDFRKRYAAGEPIAVHEFLYPFVQGYDSVVLESDVEIGGTDQTFNLLMAREIQRAYGQPPQAVITHPLLVGIDGRGEKMSKSLGNTIGLTEPPEDIYGKCMSISDSLMLEYFDVLAGGEWSDLTPERSRLAAGTGDPLAFKHALAWHVVERFAGREAAEGAAAHFERVITQKQVPEDVAEIRLGVGPGGVRSLADVLEAAGLVGSRSEARRLVAQRAVHIDGERAADAARVLAPGTYLVKVGKRRFARIVLGWSGDREG